MGLILELAIKEHLCLLLLRPCQLLVLFVSVAAVLWIVCFIHRLGAITTAWGGVRRLSWGWGQWIWAGRRPRGRSWVSGSSNIPQGSTKIALRCNLSYRLQSAGYSVRFPCCFPDNSWALEGCCLFSQLMDCIFLWLQGFSLHCSLGWVSRDFRAAAWASKSRLSWLILILPHSLGSIPLPLGLEGHSSRDEVDLFLLGQIFSCCCQTFCFWSAVMLVVALFTVCVYSAVRGFWCWYPFSNDSCTCLCTTVIQWESSTLSGVSTSSVKTCSL